MRKSLILITFLVVLTHTMAAGDITHAFKCLNTGEYDKAYLYLHEELIREPKSTVVHFGLAKLFSSHDYRGFNLDSATIYINAANAATPLPLDDKETKKYLKLGLRDFTIHALYTDIYKESFETAVAAHSFESYDRFLKFSTDANLNIQATDSRDAIKFNQIKDQNDIVTIKSFLNNYPHSKKYNEANVLYEKLVYEAMTHADTYQAYKAYIDKYPTGPYAPVAQIEYDKKLYESYRLKNNLDSYTLFEQYYPHSPYLAAVQDSIYAISTREQRPEDFHHFIKSYPANRNIMDAWYRLYDSYTQYATDSEYQAFLQMYPNSPLKEHILQDISIAKINLIPFKQNGKYGYINVATHELVIQPQYYSAYDFSGGLAAVVLNDCEDSCRYTYIDKTGKQPFTQSFSTAGDFIQGRAIVALSYCAAEPCLYGTINRRGQFIITPIYQNLLPMSEGLYAAQTTRGYGFIDAMGTVIIPFIYQDATSFVEGTSAVKKDSVWIFINHTGQQLFDKSFSSVTAFSSDLAAVTANDTTFGYINKKGEWAIAPIYEFAEPFEGDTAIVTLRETNKKSKELGLEWRYKIDKTGKTCYKLVNPNAPLMNTSKAKNLRKKKK